MPFSSAAPDAGQDVSSEAVKQQAAVEQLRERLQSNEVLDYLALDREEIEGMLRSDREREQLFERLMANQDTRETLFPGVDVVQLRRDLDALGEYLRLQLEMQDAHERFATDIQSPEKAGMFRSAFEKVKNFAKAHPYVVALLAIAAAAGAGYLAWNYLGALIPIPNPMEGAAGVADAVAAPAGGAFEAISQGEIVPPNLLPGSSSFELPLPPPPTGTPSDFFPPGLPE